MSNLSEAISEMRNMRESYDQIGAAAEAYNTGKTQLAAAITSKGVETSPTETYPEMAEKVNAISQETYEINGGEMYAKQLFGSLETPNYWNLYDILAQLLSDGRLVNYGGILLAEYYRGYDSLALSGAGAGGAYVVSDLDENGQFKMYTKDTTHVWATEFDGKGNRWVAYCFADEYHDFQITDTNTSPRSIFIGRKVGTISCLVNTRISQIVVPDGNELDCFDSGTYTHNFGRTVCVKNINSIRGTLVKSNNYTEQIYCSVKELKGSTLVNGTPNLNSVILPDNEYSEDRSFTTLPQVKLILMPKTKRYVNTTRELCHFNGSGVEFLIFPDFVSFDAIYEGDTLSGALIGYNPNLKYVRFYKENGNYALPSYALNSIFSGSGHADGIRADFYNAKKMSGNLVGTYSLAYVTTNLVYLYLSCEGEKIDTISANISGRGICTTLTDIEIGDRDNINKGLEPRWYPCQNINVSGFPTLTEENMYAHILQRLKQDEPDCGDGVTITLGSTNLAKLTSEESVQLLDDLTNIYGYTFA